MNYYITEPQVPGYLGSHTTYTSQFPARVGDMHYVFNSWPCDDIIEAYPCFAVSDRLKAKIEEAGASGVNFLPCSVAMSEDISDSEGANIPFFWRIEPTGVMRKDDVSLDKEHRLVVSDKVKRIIEIFKPMDCDFKPI